MAAQSTSFSLRTLALRLLRRVKNPQGKPSIGNPYNEDPTTNATKSVSTFISRDETERRRGETERAITELQTFFSQYSPKKRDLQNSRTFSLWLTENGLLPRFRQLWNDKVVFESKLQQSAEAGLGEEKRTRTVGSRHLTPRFIRLRSKEITNSVDSLSNLDMFLPFLQQQIKSSTNNLEQKQTLTFDPAILETTLKEIAKAADLHRQSTPHATIQSTTNEIATDILATSLSTESSMAPVPSSNTTAASPVPQSAVVQETPTTQVGGDTQAVEGLDVAITTTANATADAGIPPSTSYSEPPTTNVQPLIPTPLPTTQANIPTLNSAPDNLTPTETFIQRRLERAAVSASSQTPPALPSYKGALIPPRPLFVIPSSSALDADKSPDDVNKNPFAHFIPVGKAKQFGQALSQMTFASRAKVPQRINPLQQQLYAARWLPYEGTTWDLLPNNELSKKNPELFKYRQASRSQKSARGAAKAATLDQPEVGTATSQEVRTIIQGDKPSGQMQVPTRPAGKPLIVGANALKQDVEKSEIAPVAENLKQSPIHLDLHQRAKNEAIKLYQTAGETPFNNPNFEALIQLLYTNLLRETNLPLAEVGGQIPSINSQQIKLGQAELERLRIKTKQLHPITNLRDFLVTEPVLERPAIATRAINPISGVYPQPNLEESQLNPALPENGYQYSSSGIPTPETVASIASSGQIPTYRPFYPLQNLGTNGTMPEEDYGQTEVPSDDIADNYSPDYPNLSGIPSSLDYPGYPDSNGGNYGGNDDNYRRANPSATTQEQPEDDDQKKNDNNPFALISNFRPGLTSYFVIGIILLAIVVFVFGLNGGNALAGSSQDNGGTNSGGTSNQQNVTLQKTVNGSTENTINPGETLNYSIVVSVVTTPVQEIDVTDIIPFNFVGSPTNISAPGSFDGTKTITWKLTTPPQPGSSTTLTFSVKPSVAKGNSIYNIATATVTGQSGIGPIGGGTYTPGTSPISQIQCSQNMSASQIDQYLLVNGYKYFYNTGDQWLALSNKYGLSYQLVMAIGLQETALGNAYDSMPRYLETKDAFGLTGAGVIPSATTTWMTGAENAFINLTQTNFGYQQCSNIACIANIWAPSNASNDPNGLNANWPGNVQTFFNKLCQGQNIN